MSEARRLLEQILKASTSGLLDEVLDAAEAYLSAPEECCEWVHLGKGTFRSECGGWVDLSEQFPGHGSFIHCLKCSKPIRLNRKVDDHERG